VPPFDLFSVCQIGYRAARASAVLSLLAGCVDYHSAPLSHAADLATNLDALVHTVPTAGGSIRHIDIGRPLTIDDIGLLAILNDPDLGSAHGEIAGARAGLLQARLLPDPAASFAYGALIGGPGTAASVGGSLAEDIAALVSRPARIAAAQARLEQVDADLLWREWQVAQKARQLGLDIASADRAISLTGDERRLLGRELAAIEAALAAGNLSLAAVAPLRAAAAAADQSLTALRLDRLQKWQELDGLLGLLPGVRFAIAPPSFAALPADLEALIARLPNHRPDLAALRFGYRSAEADLRAAILGQFPPFTLGATYGSDTTGVVSAGPSFTFNLPIFDRNRGKIAAARATRLLLREQYQARLDAAVAHVRALLEQQHQLFADLASARQAAEAAASLAATARQAYAQGNLDERSLTEYQTTAFERALQVVAIERRLGDDRILLAVELGFGPPATRLAYGKVAS
jgi:outer membrane protein TolC